MVQKNKINKISYYGIILPIRVPYHNYGIQSIQKHYFVFGEAEIGSLSLLNFRDKLYVVRHVPDIVVTDETQETCLGDQDVDTDVLDI